MRRRVTPQGVAKHHTPQKKINPQLGRVLRISHIARMRDTYHAMQKKKPTGGPKLYLQTAQREMARRQKYATRLKRIKRGTPEHFTNVSQGKHYTEGVKLNKPRKRSEVMKMMRDRNETAKQLRKARRHLRKTYSKSTPRTRATMLPHTLKKKLPSAYKALKARIDRRGFQKWSKELTAEFRH